MPYWKLYYHLIWATRERQPLITTEIEPVIYRFISSKTVELGGKVLAVGGIENHIHLIAAVPPNLALSEFVKTIKGSSSRQVNYAGANQFGWQGSYSAFTVSHNQIERACQYTLNQKAHHHDGTIFPALKNFGDE